MTTARNIGVLTIGQAPRADDPVAELGQVLGPGYTIVERSALLYREMSLGLWFKSDAA